MRLLRTTGSEGRAVRLLAIGLIIGLGAYWAGSRYGERNPAAVDALRPLDAGAATALDPTEAENVRIYRLASPAVANIVTRMVEYDFFYNPVPVEGAGSGFLIDVDGHILTNYHVVQGAQTIEVTLGDSRNLLVGQRALAIGNPFGFSSTLTTGIVSALGRTVQTSENTFIDEAIQTDASINRGNSGGPLLDSHGQVIGINSAIYAPTGTTAGIGFAIPINTARRVADDLIKYGRVRRATLGAEGRALWPGLAEALKLNVQQGILIERVEPGGAAAAAGIRGGNKSMVAGLQELRIGGDVLIAVDGKTITNQVDLNLMLNRSQPGNTVTLTIVRDGKQINIPVKLGEG